MVHETFGDATRKKLRPNVPKFGKARENKAVDEQDLGTSAGTRVPKSPPLGPQLERCRFYRHTVDVTNVTH
jgi:hypothetical protein